MTTNHIEHLDKALIRPGRVDRKVEFQLANKDMSGRIFCNVFKQSEDENPDKEKRGRENERVEQVAKDFAARMPEREFSAAEILSFLMEHKHSPTNAVEKVGEWVIKATEERRKLSKNGSCSA